MPKLKSDTSEAYTFADLDSPASVEIKELIANLENSHHLCYKMMNLEAWALAETMDHFLPGFWSRFLENRRLSLKQFLQQKRTSNSQAAASLSSLGTREVEQPVGAVSTPDAF